MTRILIDQDGVIADWGRAFNEALDFYGEDAAGIPRHEQQTTFNLNEGRTLRERAILKEVMGKEGFYRGLQPIPGARTALRRLRGDGFDVRIVTSPWVSNPTCASDKLNWVARYYGAQWAQRVILTTDKTLVRGDFLIDDKPEVTGAVTPSWEHILFTQPYNRDVIGKRRIPDWSDYGMLLDIISLEVMAA